MAESRTKEQIAWAAGFLEGEGFFQRGRWTIGAGQVNREPLDRLKEMYGGTMSRRTKVTRDGHNRRPWWGWSVQGQAICLTITREILPWLTENRKQRIPWIELVQSQLEIERRYGTGRCIP